MSVPMAMNSTIDAQLPKKIPKQKTCPITRKWVINDTEKMGDQ